MALIERVFISEFNVLPNKSINIRKTTEVLKDEQPIAQTYWRCTLEPNDARATEVLGDESDFLALARAAWKDIPVEVVEGA